MSESMESDRRVAYHEAGHAVFAWWCGSRVVRVRVNAEGLMRGHTERECEFPPPDLEEDKARRWVREWDVTYRVAGAVAELIEFGDCNEEPARIELSDFDPPVLDDERDRSRAYVDGSSTNVGPPSRRWLLVWRTHP